MNPRVEGHLSRRHVHSIHTIVMEKKGPLSGAVSDYAYKRKTNEKMKTERNTGLQELFNNIEYLASRGLRLLLSSSEFKYVQDTYQLPT
jgi:hypothetical protein